MDYVWCWLFGACFGLAVLVIAIYYFSKHLNRLKKAVEKWQKTAEDYKADLDVADAMLRYVSRELANINSASIRQETDTIEEMAETLEGVFTQDGHRYHLNGEEE